MWQQYLHYGGHKILGQRTRTRHDKMKFFQGLPYEGLVLTKTVITVSFGVRFGPTSTQNARDETGNIENTFGLRRSPGEPIGTPLEGNLRDYGEYKTLVRLVRTNVAFFTCSMIRGIPFSCKFKKIRRP
jgi:hypothetical protein